MAHGAPNSDIMWKQFLAHFGTAVFKSKSTFLCLNVQQQQENNIKLAKQSKVEVTKSKKIAILVAFRAKKSKLLTKFAGIGTKVWKQNGDQWFYTPFAKI